MKQVLLGAVILLVSVQSLVAQTATYAILPKPTQLEAGKGSYTLPVTPTISVQSTNPEVRRIAQVLADQLAKATGYSPVISTGNAPKGISFVEAKGAKLGAEGYTLIASPRQIVITAEQPQGFFYGVQSLIQLMPAAIFSPTKVNGVAWTVPACTITDQPRYGYRGSMLDVGRYFYPVPFIKKYIDLLHCTK